MIINKKIKHHFDVVLLRSNPASYELRVTKISKSLSKTYRVLILGWDREIKHSLFENLNENLCLKRLRLKAPYANFNLLSYYPLFWIWILKNLIIYRPRIVHACDLECLIPSLLYKLISPSKVIFDNFDRFAMAFVPPKHRLLYSLINKLEEVLSSKSDALITVAEDRLRSFGNYVPKNVAVIMNCPENTQIKDYPASQGIDESFTFTLVYAGGISHERGLILVNQAISDLKDTRLIVAGRVFDDTLEYLNKNPNCNYLGLLKADEVLNLEKKADIIPVLYDPVIPINQVASPNKFFEAMMLGVPVITNVCREIVKNVDFGIIVEYNLESVKNAIILLKDDVNKRKKMGATGRKAFEKKYNWESMEKKLITLYEKLLYTQ